MTIVEQLVSIYYNEEPWQKNLMTYDSAFRYHKMRYENGDIHTYEEDGVVLGYYERYFVRDTCILYNVWVRSDKRQGKVFKSLYRHFFKTMPKNIKEIVGQKQKLGGKLVKEKINKEKHYGKR